MDNPNQNHTFDPACKALSAENIPAAAAAKPSSAESGTVERIAGGLDVYIVGAGNPRCIVVAYDAFGFLPANNRQNCDDLAAAGFFVIMPDVFRGSPRPFPAAAAAASAASASANASGAAAPSSSSSEPPAKTQWAPPDAASIDADILDGVLPFAVSRGAKVFGLLGFCFGGDTAMRLAASGRFAACGGIHAARMGDGRAEAMLQDAMCPIMLLQGGNDPSLAGANEVLRGMMAAAAESEETKWSVLGVVARQSVLRTFWDMNHGWCGATGNRAGDLRIRAAAEEAIITAIRFFTHTVRFINAE